MHPPSASSTFTNNSTIYDNVNLNFSLGSAGKATFKSRTPGKKQARNHRITPNAGPTPQRARAAGKDTDNQSTKISKLNILGMKEDDKPPEWWNNLTSFDGNNASFVEAHDDSDSDSGSDILIDLTKEDKTTAPALESDFDDEYYEGDPKVNNDIHFRNIRIAESDVDELN